MLKTSFFFGLLRKKGNKFVKEKGKKPTKATFYKLAFLLKSYQKQ